MFIARNRAEIKSRVWRELTALVSIILVFILSTSALSVNVSALNNTNIDIFDVYNISIKSSSGLAEYVMPDWNTIDAYASKGTEVKIKKICEDILEVYTQSEWTILKGNIDTTVIYSTSANTIVPLEDPVITGGKLSSAQKAVVDKAIGVFTSSAADHIVSYQLEKQIGTAKFDPENTIVSSINDTIYSWAFQIFNILSNLIFVIIIVVIGADLLYYFFEPIRPYIGREKGGSMGSSMGGYGGTVGSQSAGFCFPVVSQRMIKIVNGESGMTGGGGAYGGSMGTQPNKAGNPMLTYIFKTTPLVLIAIVYLVLSGMGYWTRAVSWLSGIVAQALNWIFG